MEGAGRSRQKVLHLLFGAARQEARAGRPGCLGQLAGTGSPSFGHFSREVPKTLHIRAYRFV
jgi:hypothetical protein